MRSHAPKLQSPSSGADRRHVAPAFTLVELTLVVLIMGITSAIAAPRYADFIAQNRLDAATRRVVADLNYASRESKHRSASQQVTFDVTGDAYALDGLASITRKSQPNIVELDEEPYGATIVSANFGEDSILIYDGYGEPDSGGTIVLAVGAHQRTLTLSTTSFTTIDVELK